MIFQIFWSIVLKIKSIKIIKGLQILMPLNKLNNKRRQLEN